MREILFVTGEPSGEQHAAAVARALQARDSTLKLVGVGGDAMRDAGVALIEHVSRLTAMGFIEPVKKLWVYRRVRAALRARLESGSVALVILVDFGGFNLNIAELAARFRVPVLYFITPQVWASRAGRMDRMARTVTHAAVILPFEKALLESRGIAATFVGHPLLDKAESMPTRDEARRRVGVDQQRKLLALFPGSRKAEIRHHLDAFIASAQELKRRVPDLEVIVSSAPGVVIPSERCPFPIWRGSSFDLFRAADAALCKSGTTTLEAALALCPLVVAYRTDPVSFAIAKRVIRIPFIGMVNVLAGKMIAREFVQGALRPREIADELQQLLDSTSPARQAQIDELVQVRDSLGRAGAAERVADIALSLMDRGSS